MLVNSFAMLDILDLAELMFADGGCFQTYHVGWLVTYYTALAISIMLMTFSYGLEQQKDQDNEASVDLIFTVLNLCFKDVLFLVLRSYKAYRMKHIYVDAIFMTKEISALIMRSVLVISVYFCF